MSGNDVNAAGGLKNGITKASERKTGSDRTAFIRYREEEYTHAGKITPVMDNLSTHKAGPLHEAFSPEEATRIRDRFELVDIPTHGGWLNMTKIEPNVVIGRRLNRKTGSLPQVETAVSAWQALRDNLNAKAHRHFATQDVPVKLRCVLSVIGVVTRHQSLCRA